MKIFKINKWFLLWGILILLIAVFIFSAISYENEKWIGNLLQTIGTISGVYLTIVIFLHSKEESDKQFREQINHLQQLNQAQITELQNATNLQINAFRDITQEQIKASQESTQLQIEAFQKETERHIETLREVTFEQISSFEKQITEVTNKLSDNSILLAEILGRELEKAISHYQTVLNQENAKYNNLSEWKFLRTPQEREQQLNNQLNRINQIKKGWEYLVEKYKQVKHFLNPNQIEG